MATQIPSDKYKFQNYKEEDKDLIPIVDIDSSLTGSSFIEFNIYDLNDTLLYHTPNYSKYSVSDDSPSSGEGISQFNIDPDLDVLSQGYDSGNYVAYYTFVTNQVGNPFQKLYIEEISSDRTEIRLNSTALEAYEIENQTDNFIDFRESNIYFTDFLLNFGNNQQIIANNIRLDDDDDNNPTVLIKLYEELPPIFQEKTQLYIVTTYSTPEAFSVNYTPTISEFVDSIPLNGPNFSIPVKNEVNNSSQNLSYTDIIAGSTTALTNQVQGLLSESSINISIDYSDYNDFIHFSSAQTRLENFYYKVSLLEQYSSSISSLDTTTGSFASIQILENKVSSIITNFDGYDRFLYYNSGSKSWPKTNTTQPYELAKTGSLDVINWYGSTDESKSTYGGQILSSSFFDNNNPDSLEAAIPEYLREDSANQPYDLFVDMVAQYYDNVWLYTKDVTNKYNTDNRLDFGISKDLVASAIKDFGVKLYQNNFSNAELYTAFLGMTPEGSLFPFPEITGSLPVPTGYEFVDTLISASNDVISMDDTNKSLYKRIYHNMPYLLKSKGTTTGLRALITSYGIPDTILRISEFGGKDQVNANDYDLYQNNFNYAFNTSNNFISTSFQVNSAWGSLNDRPQTIQFRFKAEEITSTVSPYGLTNLTQSLLTLKPTTGPSVALVLEYPGSGLSTGSYSGAPINPNYQYGNLKLYPISSSPNFTSISLPFFDGGWWSVMITFIPNATVGELQLSAGNKIYNGNDGTSLGFYDEISIAAGVLVTEPYKNSNTAYFATSSLIYPSTTQPAFSGSLQEIRYYNTIISGSVFKDYIMNPLSFEGNGINSAPDQLIFRAALGSELLENITPTSIVGSVYGSAIYGSSNYGGSIITSSFNIDRIQSSSIHPKVTGSWVASSSFDIGSSFYIEDPTSFVKNEEILFLDQPAVGIKNRINDKVRWEDNVLPGNVLSQYRKIEQTTEASASYSENINYLEVAFSPQNQINDDIIGQMGHFNVGDYIGDPRQRFTKNIYPELNELSEDYFKKYIQQYDLTDFVRLIKFFDNSLFKMIKDFIPARTSLSSGIVIKQHLLERNKYPQPQVSREEIFLTGSIQSKQIWDPTTETFYISSSLIVNTDGGAAGSFNEFNSTTTSPSGSQQLGPDNPYNITQSWSVTTPSLSGSVTTTHNSQDEFYDGELSGSIMLITNGELNPGCEQFKNAILIPAKYKLRTYNETAELSSDSFLNSENTPTPGYIQTFFGTPPPPPLEPPSPADYPSVTNQGSVPFQTFMTLYGEVTSQGSSLLTEKGFYFGTDSTVTNNPKTPVAPAALGQTTLSKFGLTPLTTYYSTIYAVNDTGETIGNTLTTSTTGYPPTITTLTPNPVTSTSMNLRGDVTSQGSTPITEKGFYFGTSPTYYNNPKLESTPLNQLFQSGLTKNTTYYIMFYAINSVGVALGASISRTTPSFP